MPRKQKFPHLLSSKWTAHQKIDGWRHFQVVNRKNQGQWVFAEMVAACDPTVRFWINAKLLKDKQLWQAGWRSLQEVDAPLELDEWQMPEGSQLGMLSIAKIYNQSPPSQGTRHSRR